jgi:hypothetical protein
MIPSAEAWTEALVEEWHHKRLVLGDTASSFFRLEESQARVHLGELGARLRRVCVEDTTLFRVTIAQQLQELVDAHRSEPGAFPAEDLSFVESALRELSLLDLQRKVIEPWLAACGFGPIKDITAQGTALSRRILLAVREEFGEQRARVVVPLGQAGSDDSGSIAALLEIAGTGQPTAGVDALPPEEVILVTAERKAPLERPAAAGAPRVTQMTGDRLAKVVVRQAPRVVVALSADLRQRLQKIEENNQLSELARYGQAPRLSDIFIEADYGVLTTLGQVLSTLLVKPEKGELDYASKIAPFTEAERALLASASRPSGGSIAQLGDLLTILAGKTEVVRTDVEALVEPETDLNQAEEIFNRLLEFQRMVTTLARFSFLERRGLLLTPEEHAAAEVFCARLSDSRRLATYKHFLRTRGTALVLGNAGAGKTTLLKRLFGSWDRALATPVFVRATELSNVTEAEVLGILSKQYGLQCPGRPGDFVEKCGQGELAFLVDGLDEAGEQARPLASALRALARRHPACPLIVTCRPTVPLDDWDDAIRVELCEFTDAQLFAFVVKWFADRPGTAESLVTTLKRSTAIRRLATSPLIAALLCLTYDANAELPDSEAALYEERVRLLLGEWERGKGLPVMPEEARRAYVFFLRDLAFQMHTRQIRRIHWGEARKVASRYYQRAYNASVDSVLRDCVSRTLLFQEHDGELSFGHLTNQEFFTGQYLAHFNDVEAVASKLGKPWWTNVLRYYAATVGDIRSLLARAETAQHWHQMQELRDAALVKA